MLRVGAALQVPDEDVPVVAGRQDDTGVEGVGLQHKHLGLVALRRRLALVWCQGALDDITAAQTHFKDMQQLSSVGVPHFEEMVVHSGDDRVVMAIPRHHGDFGFEVAFLFARWLNSGREQGIDGPSQNNTARFNVSTVRFPSHYAPLGSGKQATSWQL